MIPRVALALAIALAALAADPWRVSAQGQVYTPQSGAGLNVTFQTERMGGSRVLFYGEVRNTTGSTFERVVLLAEGLDETGKVVSRARSYISGTIGPRDRSQFELRFLASGSERRYRIAVESFRAGPELTAARAGRGLRTKRIARNRVRPRRSVTSAVEQQGLPIVREFHRIAGGEDAPRVKLEGALEVLFGAFGEADAEFSGLVLGGWMKAREDKQFRLTMAWLREQMRLSLTEILTEGMEGGAFRAALEPEAVAAVILGAAEGCLLQTATQGGPVPPADILGTLLKLLVEPGDQRGLSSIR